MHSDDKEERRRYLSDLARLKRIRAKQRTINFNNVLKDHSPSTHKKASIYKIDADGKTTGLEEEKAFPSQKELDIAIARKDYKEYIKKQNEKKELQLFPIKRE